MRKRSLVYLDYNASAPLLPEVARSMRPFLERHFGNPSSSHGPGSEARCAVEEARAELGSWLGVEPRRVVFTSGGTEANNLAILGVALASERPGHVVTSRIEHSSVLEPLRFLEARGWRVTYLEVDHEGRISPEDVLRAIGPDTRLVSLGWANNEIGTIQPVREIASVCRNRGVPLHLDAVQAAGKIPVDASCADFLSLSAHKIGGPKGVGALVVSETRPWEPLLRGGPQERGRRAGTENVAGIVGFGTAARAAGRRLESWSRLEALRELLWEGLRELGARRLSPVRGCLPNTLSVRFPFLRGEVALAALDLEGIAASTGSACAAGAAEPSHVLLAIGVDPAHARDGIRLSLGPETTREDVERTLSVFSHLVGRTGREAARA
ncbi:MAG: cysteine desulfurase IscS [Candidatus Binatia bacterium]|nr:MAG: cysteine desulfurase IscS [Candidatus Binatia bacterium]